MTPPPARALCSRCHDPIAHHTQRELDQCLRHLSLPTPRPPLSPIKHVTVARHRSQIVLTLSHCPTMEFGCMCQGIDTPTHDIALLDMDTDQEIIAAYGIPALQDGELREMTWTQPLTPKE